MDPRRWALALVALDHELELDEVVPRGSATPAPDAADELRRRFPFGDTYDVAGAILHITDAITKREVDETAGWALIMEFARHLQRRHASWQEFADAWAGGLAQISDERQRIDDADVRRLLSHGVWMLIPWDTNLDPVRQRWCVAIAGPLVVDAGGDPAFLGGARVFDAERGRERLAGLGLATRADVIAYARERMQGTGERALALARVVAAIGYAAHAGVMTEEDAWQVVLVAGKLAQQTYTSWVAFGDGFERAWQAERNPVEPMAMHVRALRGGLWSALAWNANLEVTLFTAARPPILRASCPRCTLQRTRPSPTAFVYCDRCAALVDYDLASAPPWQPPPAAYMALRAQLHAELAAARSDRERFRALQLRLCDAWIEACPADVPPRTRDAEYRARYAAWLADTETRVAFDAHAAEQEATMTETAVTFPSPTRVDPARFRTLCDAVFAYQARRDELTRDFPDDAPHEVVQRIARAPFVRAWLPYLEPADARTLVERAGFAREYFAVEPLTTLAFACPACAGALAVIVDAHRVVCDHCGRIVEVTR